MVYVRSIANTYEKAGLQVFIFRMLVHSYEIIFLFLFHTNLTKKRFHTAPISLFNFTGTSFYPNSTSIFKRINPTSKLMYCPLKIFVIPQRTLCLFTQDTPTQITLMLWKPKPDKLHTGGSKKEAQLHWPYLKILYHTQPRFWYLKNQKLPLEHHYWLQAHVFA